MWVTSGGMYSQGLDVDDLEMDAADYKGTAQYARAKRAQVELLGLWAERLAPTAVAHAMHPGWADTPGVESSLPTFRKLTGPALRTPDQGARHLLALGRASPLRSAASSGSTAGRGLDRAPPGTGTTDPERARLGVGGLSRRPGPLITP